MPRQQPAFRQPNCRPHRDQEHPFSSSRGYGPCLHPKNNSILPVLDTFTPPDETKVMISYRGIARYAKVKSHSTVSSAIRRFQNLHFLRKAYSSAKDGFRNCNVYEWTLSGDDLRGLPGRRTPGRWQRGDPPQLDLTLLQVLIRRTAEDFPRQPVPEGVPRTTRPKALACDWIPRRTKVCARRS